jgi:hypothetical protein
LALRNGVILHKPTLCNAKRRIQCQTLVAPPKRSSPNRNDDHELVANTATHIQRLAHEHHQASPMRTDGQNIPDCEKGYLNIGRYDVSRLFSFKFQASDCFTHILVLHARIFFAVHFNRRLNIQSQCIRTRNTNPSNTTQTFQHIIYDITGGK